jgi:trans-aconitate methyltransferase
VTAASHPAKERWERAYTEDKQHSWDQPGADVSIALLEAAGLATADRVLDVGAGTSPLAGQLLARGVGDVSVLDISPVALNQARRRLGVDAERVHWIEEDLLDWSPQRRYTFWHDRAVFHFFTEPVHVARYRSTLLAATGPGSVAIIATFAPDGPTHCSGLPVRRYSVSELFGALAMDADILATRTQNHQTPFGSTQPFTWLVLRRRS